MNKGTIDYSLLGRLGAARAACREAEDLYDPTQPKLQPEPCVPRNDFFLGVATALCFVSAAALAGWLFWVNI